MCPVELTMTIITASSIIFGMVMTGVTVHYKRKQQLAGAFEAQLARDKEHRVEQDTFYLNKQNSIVTHYENLLGQMSLRIEKLEAKVGCLELAYTTKQQEVIQLSNRLQHFIDHEEEIYTDPEVT